MNELDIQMFMAYWSERDKWSSDPVGTFGDVFVTRVDKNTTSALREENGYLYPLTRFESMGLLTVSIRPGDDDGTPCEDYWMSFTPAGHNLAHYIEREII